MTRPVPVAFSAARLLALGVALLGGVVLIGAEFTRSIPDPDYGAYRDAALRIWSGDVLYPPADPDAGTTYRYAPWFAAAWIPFALGGSSGIAAWQLILVVAALYVTATIARLGGHAAIVLAALSLAQISAVPLGNVDILIVALLVWRRCDGWSIGIAASLKVYPILLVLGFVAERRWRDSMIALGVAATLWLPALAFGITDYSSDPGGANGSTGGYLWDLGVWPLSTMLIGGVAAFLAWRRSRWTTLAIAAAIPWLVPRYTSSAISYVLGSTTRLAENTHRDHRAIQAVHRRT